MHRAKFGLLLTETKWQWIWNTCRTICNTSGYCIFVYSTFGQLCWPWMMPHTIGLLAHVQCRMYWKSVLESSGRVLEFFVSRQLGTLFNCFYCK